MHTRMMCLSIDNGFKFYPNEEKVMSISREVATNTVLATENASAALVDLITAMRKLSSVGFSQQREEITMQIGRLQVLADLIRNEHKEGR